MKKQDSNSKKKIFMNSLKEIGRTAQIHGVPRIFSNTNILAQLTWLIFLLSSALMCTFYSYKSAKSFFEYPIVTSIDSILENPMPFPSVTFCSLKPPKYDYNLSDIIIYCKFSFVVDCSKEPYFLKAYNQTPHLKTCYQFNLGFKNGSFLNLTRSGIFNGLMVSLFEGLHEEPRSDLYNLSVSYGYQLIIHNKSEKITSDDAITIQPGVSTFISLKKIVYHKLSEPYNNCINDLNSYHKFDSTLYEEILKSKYSYSQKNCLDYAYLKSINCSSSYEKYFNTCPLDESGVKKIQNGYFDFYYNQEYLKYLNNCPLECDTIQFERSIYQAYYPSEEEYSDFLKNENLIKKFPNGKNTTIDEMRKSIYNVHIYFTDLKQTLVSQKPKCDAWDFVATIGGLFGLFLGLSFLSLVDIIQILFELITIYCNKTPIHSRN